MTWPCAPESIQQLPTGFPAGLPRKLAYEQRLGFARLWALAEAKARPLATRIPYAMRSWRVWARSETRTTLLSRQAPVERRLAAGRMQTAEGMQPEQEKGLAPRRPALAR